MDKMKIINDIEEFIKVVKVNPANTWYRGVANSDYELLPSLLRKNITDLYERTLINEFKQDYLAYHKPVSGSLELYSLMQHYGLPTRLLDWSCSPLIALFFALEEAIECPYVAVYYMDPKVLNNLALEMPFAGVLPEEVEATGSPQKILEFFKDITNPVAIRPSFSNRRIIAQQGQFTLHLGSMKIEKLMGSSLNKLLIDNSAMNRLILKRHLHSLGINEDFIYQDLNGLSRRVIRTCSPEADQLKEFSDAAFKANVSFTNAAQAT